MRDLSLNFIWKRKRNENCYIPIHAHNFYELVFYTYGNGDASLGNSSYHFAPNTFVVIPPNTYHDERHFTNAEVICLGFSCAESLDEMFCQDDAGKILSIVKDILKESSKQAYDYQTMLITKLNELYIQLLRMQAPKTVASKNFEHIIQYLTENYHEKILLSGFAEELNISYDYFQHKFKELTGFSPQQFLLNQRLLASKELLLNSRLSCTEIAYRCGFSTSAQFSMLFKTHQGMSPHVFRSSKHLR